MRTALLECCDFDWSKISPAIFGSLFQGVMEAAERRSLGAHYTSEENILKLICPLFLDALRAELAAIKSGPERGRSQKLEEFHNKLARLKFFDPACGCGNFLIITYRELRKLETEVLKELRPSGQAVLDIADLTKVSVDQFYGIEIEEFPAQIARVAMWLMDHIANIELGYAFGQSFTRLPLTKAAHIVHGNALQLDWKTVITPGDCSYILGNPPFVGKHYQSHEQKKGMAHVFNGLKSSGNLDFVTCWHYLAAQYIQGTKIQVGFVSTNSICQGEQVSILWSALINTFKVKIHFAHRTFVWQSEARGKAHVHCIIVGFANYDTDNKLIYEYEADHKNPVSLTVSNISPYVVGGCDSVVVTRSSPICEAPELKNGGKPTEGGNLLLDNAEKEELIKAEPEAEPWIRPFLMGEDFINNIPRWRLGPLQLLQLSSEKSDMQRHQTT
jgi:type II restriction/modification system DNA methylase subunit YeeA